MRQWEPWIWFAESLGEAVPTWHLDALQTELGAKCILRMR
jgi:hypothetical protein